MSTTTRLNRVKNNQIGASAMRLVTEIRDNNFIADMTTRAIENGDTGLADLIQLSSFENILKALGLKGK